MENQKMTLEETLQILEDAHNRYLNIDSRRTQRLQTAEQTTVLGDAKIPL